eukprot:TRINITY_DN21795_c0_g1_i1.p1 TRINITY_DN21795_c0_g1~~TRINITY_DN21795_c0_g1_i1.p1  ORF type:complete len:472 (+),score=87.69 TRINITY_DN21795_c0_g1_i1:98-1513(+)
MASVEQQGNAVLEHVVVTALPPLLTAEKAFAAVAPYSDHLPQAFRVAVSRGGLECVEVLTWNVMTRGRSGGCGREGTALAGKALTNNGLNLDEGVEAYEDRILERVLPVVASWWPSSVGGEESLKTPTHYPRLACLQEFPAAPLLQEEILRQLRIVTARPQLQLAVWSAPVAAPLLAFHCNAVLWDDRDWLAAKLRPSHCSSSSPGVNGASAVVDFYIARQGFVTEECLNIDEKPTLRLMSIHLPFLDLPGGPRYAAALEQARKSCSEAAVAAADGVLTILAGDLNADTEVALESAVFHARWGRVVGSAVWHGQHLTVDGVVALAGAGNKECSQHIRAPDPLSVSSSETRTQRIPNLTSGVLRGDADAQSLFGVGGDREAFIAARVRRELQDDPRLWRLDDLALATVGRWPFADQERVLGRLLKRAAANGSSAARRKRVRLQNPMAAGLGAAADTSSASSYEDESSSEHIA